MTRKELEKIFDDTEKRICTPEVVKKIKDDLENSGKEKPSTPAELSIRVNRILDREILLEVLSKVLADK